MNRPEDMNKKPIETTDNRNRPKARGWGSSEVEASDTDFKMTYVYNIKGG